MTNHCRALIIHCTDFRLQDALRSFLEKQKLLGTTDIVALAGGVQEIAQSERPEKSTLFRQVQISSDLNQIKEVLLVNHTDCSAYGGREAFTDRSEEMERHTDDLRTARAVISRAFPELAVRLFIADIKNVHGNPDIVFVAVS